MHRSAVLLLLSAALSFAQTAPAPAAASGKQPFTIQALLSLTRVSEPQLSPDGRTVVFTAQTVDVEANTRPRQVYAVPLAGGTPVLLTREGSANSRPRWSPDGKRIYFQSNRGGSAQVWAMDPDGANPRAVTSFAAGTDGVMVSATGRSLVFTSEVFPECGADDACNAAKIKAEEQGKMKARTYTGLLYRHWSDFSTKRRKHILMLALDAEGKPGTLRDLTPGNREVPPFSLGGPDDYAISPDGKEVAYAANTEADPATSTNADLFVVPIEGGESKRLTATNQGADLSPVYSPDGKWLAWRSQERAGYESDKWRLMMMERATERARSLTDDVDRSVGGMTWLPDSSQVFFTLESQGRSVVQRIAPTGGSAKPVVNGNSHVDDVQFTPDGKVMLYSEMTGSRPIELYRVEAAGGRPVALTRMNDDKLARFGLSALEEVWVDRPDKSRVHSFVVKPAGFQTGRKYPVLFLIHGGPQGAWGESWSYRWNPHVFANAGYVVVMPNPRGSTGYGQKFTDDIRGDWGGKVYEDIMAVVDHTGAQSYADANRFAAAGGSYGGYMANWMLGHTDRFKALVSHAGVYDLRSMAGETEEIWFPKWEFQGMPWDNPELYAKWSPSYYVDQFKTPTLVLHGELDYRVPVGQGMQLFTALQMKQVPSKMVLFPDEGHWILKPQNSVYWYDQFIGWVDEFTKGR